MVFLVKSILLTGGDGNSGEKRSVELMCDDGISGEKAFCVNVTVF